MGVTRRIERLFRYGLYLYLLTLAAVVLTTKLLHDRHSDPAKLPTGLKVAVVLGSGFAADGVLGYNGRVRARAGAKLSDLGLIGTVIVTGGPFSFGDGTSSDHMADLLLKRGLPRDRIILEKASLSTLDNLRNTRDIADRLAGSSDGTGIVIVTQSSHLARSYLLALYLGWPNVSIYPAEPYMTWSGAADPGLSLREAGAWWFNLAKIAGLEALSIAGYSDAERREMIR